MPCTIAYHIPYLPDLTLNKYIDYYGNISIAKEIVESSVYEFARLLTSLYPPEKVAITLRYAFYPNEDILDRLKIFLLVYIDIPEGKEYDRLALAERMLQNILLFNDPLPKINPELASSLLSLCSKAALIFRRESLEELDLDNPIPKYTHKYLYHIHALSEIEAFDFVFNLFFDQFEEPLIVDFSFSRVELSSILDALREELKYLNVLASGFYKDEFDFVLQEENYKEKRSLVASFVRERYSQLLTVLNEGPAFAYNIRLAGSNNVTNFANYIASILSPNCNFIVEELKKPTKTLDAIKTGKLRTFLFPQWNCYSKFLIENESLLKKSVSVETLDRWKKLSRLVHIFPANIVKQILKLPVFVNQYPKVCRLESEFLYGQRKIDKKYDVLIGEIVDRSQKCYVTTSQINKHVFVAGVTGSGKTTTIMEVLVDLAEKGVPFLVIEPSKKEYRKLIDIPILKNNLRIFTCGNEAISPLKLNPFEFDYENISLQEHLSLLESCFKGTLPLHAPLPELLMEAVEEAYQEKGWFDGEISQPDFPTIKDVYEALPKVFQKFQYSGEISSDLRTALQVRLSSLRKRIIGSVLNIPKTIPNIKTLLQEPTIIELDRLSIEHANLVAFYLLLSINQYLRTFPSKHKLRNVLVVEEAHNLIGRSSQIVTTGEADPRAEAAQFMVKLLAEVRALGMGLIIADQTPSAVAPEVIKNTGVKIVHRTVAGEDREVLAESMLLDEIQKDDLARLQTGYCYLYHEDLYKPQKVKVKLHKTLIDGKMLKELSDDQLQKIVKTKDWWRNIFTDIEKTKEYWEKFFREVTEGFVLLYDFLQNREEDWPEDIKNLYLSLKDVCFVDGYKKIRERLYKDFKAKGFLKEYAYYILLLKRMQEEFLKIKKRMENHVSF